jgi:hypothetical protein
VSELQDCLIEEGMNRAGEDTDVWHDRLEVFRMLSIGVCVPAAARATTPAREAEFLSSTSRQLACFRIISTNGGGEKSFSYME